jgi:hypothetical protein
VIAIGGDVGFMPVIWMVGVLIEPQNVARGAWGRDHTSADQPAGQWRPGLPDRVDARQVSSLNS